MLRLSRRLLAVASLAASTLAASSSGAQSSPPPPAAGTEAELSAARKLFSQALHDEGEHRFEVALGEFRRVKEVRDTAPVEYHIGVCLEGLGHLADALAAYDAAARLSEGDRSVSDVANGSRDRLEALSKRVGHLRLALSSHAPEGADVRVDGKSVPASGDLVLDPGGHHVEATAPGVAPFESNITLPEGGSASLTLFLDPPPTAPPLRPPAGPSEEPRTRTAHGSGRTWGWLAIGAGGALLAGSVVSFVLRENDINIANRDCPGGACPGAINPEAQAATNRARVEGPLGLGLGAAGLVAAGVGVYLVVSAPSDASAWTLGPAAWRGGAGLELRGAL